MFSSIEWFESQWARRPDGKDTKKKVLDTYFWKRSLELVKITEPRIKVLRMVDGEKLAMGHIYELWIRERSRYGQLTRTG